MSFNPNVLWPVLRLVRNLVLLPSAIVALSRLISYFCGIKIQLWIIVLMVTLCLPVAFIIIVLWDLSSVDRAAAALGAVMPPARRGKWPGNIDMLLAFLEEFNTGYPGQYLDDIMKTMGHSFNMRVLWENIIFTSEPEHIKAILASDFVNFEKGAHFGEAMSSVLGIGVFNSDGDMWKFHRAMTRPFFSRDRISHFELFDRHSEVAITKMKSRLRAGYPIDFQDLVSRFTLDSATDFLFGHCVDSLSTDLPYPHNVSSSTYSIGSSAAENFVRAFSEAQYVVAVRVWIGWPWPLLEIFKDKSKDSMDVVNAYLDPILEQVMSKAKEHRASHETDKVNEDETLLDHLVKYSSDPVVLHDETLNILIAGKDTTAATLTFAVYLLARHPDVLARLREEILSHVGPHCRPSYEDIKEMKFLKAVLNETLRLYPPVPFNMRTSVNATTWPSREPDGKPIYIPKATDTAYSVFLMHRRKDLWGPDADKFDPDRFLDDRLHKYLTPNPFIFLPFNAGPRICLGQQFAYNEMSFFLIRLLQNMDSVTLDLDAQPPDSRVPQSWKHAQGRQSIEQIWPKMHLTLYAKGGMWVRMTEAATAEM